MSLPREGQCSWGKASLWVFQLLSGVLETLPTAQLNLKVKAVSGNVGKTFFFLILKTCLYRSRAKLTNSKHRVSTITMEGRKALNDGRGSFLHKNQRRVWPVSCRRDQGRTGAETCGGRGENGARLLRRQPREPANPVEKHCFQKAG